jgi:hypothetical protein
MGNNMCVYNLSEERKQMRKKILRIVKKGIRNVGENYFKLKTTYEPNGIVRERAFCYELYHQIRKLQENGIHEIPFSLNGEIDKRGHQEFEEDDRKNPDFIFHIPGKMEGNTTIIEVKGSLENKYIKGTLCDLKTILTFIKKYKYKFGIMIIYNYSKENAINMLGSKLLEFKNNDLYNQYNEYYSKVDIIFVENNINVINKTLKEILEEI